MVQYSPGVTETIQLAITARGSSGDGKEVISGRESSIMVWDAQAAQRSKVALQVKTRERSKAAPA